MLAVQRLEDPERPPAEARGRFEGHASREDPSFMSGHATSLGRREPDSRGRAPLPQSRRPSDLAGGDLALWDVCSETPADRSGSRRVGSPWLLGRRRRSASPSLDVGDVRLRRPSQASIRTPPLGRRRNTAANRADACFPLVAGAQGGAAEVKESERRQKWGLTRPRATGISASAGSDERRRDVSRRAAAQHAWTPGRRAHGVVWAAGAQMT
jgi:hypothetical protein